MATIGTSLNDLAYEFFLNGGAMPAGLGYSSPCFTIAQDADNQIILCGSATGDPVTITTTGVDTDVNLVITPKGLDSGNDNAFVQISPSAVLSRARDWYYPSLVTETEGNNSGDIVQVIYGDHGVYHGFLGFGGTLAAPVAITTNLGFGIIDWAAWNGAAINSIGSIRGTTVTVDGGGVTGKLEVLGFTGAEISGSLSVATRTGTPAKFACFDSGGKLVESAVACA